MTMHVKLLLPMAIALLVAGCGRDEEQAGELSEVPAAFERPLPSDASLSDMNRSGISGSARLIRGEGGIDVELTLDGAAPGTKYIARIYRGECGDRGPEVTSLGHISVTETGGLLTERIDPALLDPRQRHYVEVRSADQTPVACANLDLSALNLTAPPPGAGAVQQPRPFEEGGEGGGQAASEGAEEGNPQRR